MEGKGLRRILDVVEWSHNHVIHRSPRVDLGQWWPVRSPSGAITAAAPSSGTTDAGSTGSPPPPRRKKNHTAAIARTARIRIFRIDTSPFPFGAGDPVHRGSGSKRCKTRNASYPHRKRAGLRGGSTDRVRDSARPFPERHASPEGHEVFRSTPTTAHLPSPGHASVVELGSTSERIVTSRRDETNRERRCVRWGGMEAGKKKPPPVPSRSRIREPEVQVGHLKETSSLPRGGADVLSL